VGLLEQGPHADREDGRLQQQIVVSHPIEKEGTIAGSGLKRCNDLIYQVVTFLCGRIGNEKATAYFQRLALKYRISNNLLQDTKNFLTGQILFDRRKNG
jgi:hypothetical protein